MESYLAGIEEHILDGVSVRIYDREKTVVDCFKFRNKIGMEVAIEALQDYMALGNKNLAKLSFYSKINRVKNIISPYIDAHQ